MIYTFRGIHYDSFKKVSNNLTWTEAIQFLKYGKAMQPPRHGLLKRAQVVNYKVNEQYNDDHKIIWSSSRAYVNLSLKFTISSNVISITIKTCHNLF